MTAQPQPGDLVRVIRTKTEVFEGYWSEVDEDPGSTGHHFLEVAADGISMRVRDQGPVTFSTGSGGEYVESDTIEVIEARNGAPYAHLVADWCAVHYPPRAPKPSWLARRRARGIVTDG